MTDKELLQTAERLYRELGGYYKHKNLDEVYYLVWEIYQFMTYDLQCSVPIGVFERLEKEISIEPFDF